MSLLWPSRRFVTRSNPQGVIAAPVGAFCVNEVSGVVYEKLAGGSTQFGWYRVSLPYTNQFGTFTRGAGNPVTGAHCQSSAAVLSGSSLATEIFGSTTTKNWAQIYGAAALGNNILVAQFGAIGSAPCSVDQDLGTANDIDVVHEVWTSPRPRSISTVTDITNIRMWFALLSQSNVLVATGAMANSSNLFTAMASGLTVALGNFGMAIRYDTSVPDATFVAVTCNNNGVAYTQTVTPITGAPVIAANTPYSIRIRYVQADGPAAYFSINDGAETKVTANVGPGGNATARHTCIVRHALSW